MSMDDQLARLREVMHRLRRECPWDAQQTHRSLVTYLVEETGEVVDAIEAGDDDDLREELGDLLLQVYFHAEIAAQQGRFTLDDVARGIADKLVRRHPYVFGDGEVPDDLNSTWEARKRAEKGRSSSLEGIAESLSVVARATKVASRARNHRVPVDLPDAPLASSEVGEGIISLVVRAQAHGIDADQAARDALRALEQRVAAAESDVG
ncbi:MazG family protein [Propionibacteriaceae bacterium G57]|uniref:MazG family protein n=1 Tax=Aestuariimicrobium sp. G57 TaxID=3418485 RepID=UPI003DA6E81C